MLTSTPSTTNLRVLLRVFLCSLESWQGQSLGKAQPFSEESVGGAVWPHAQGGRGCPPSLYVKLLDPGGVSV